MTRRPRRRRPPLLPDPEPARARDSDPRPATARARLVAAHVTGRHPHLGRAEISHAVARLVAGAPDATFDLDLGALDRDEVWQAITDGWGWNGDGARAVITPERTIEGHDGAVERLLAVAGEGGRIAVATSQPASLLPLARAFAQAAAAAGGDVLVCDDFRLPGRGDRALWWHDQVAVVVADGALVRDDGLEAGDEWLFAVGRPDLVVGDRGFAAAGLAAGHETIALADFDALALGVAQRRGLPVRLVPLAMGCPPAAYAPLIEAVTDRSSPTDAAQGVEAPVTGDPDAVTHTPHSTTCAPGAYAPPGCGEG
jgi:hypothetical protein